MPVSRTKEADCNTAVADRLRLLYRVLANTPDGVFAEIQEPLTAAPRDAIGEMVQKTIGMKERGCVRL